MLKKTTLLTFFSVFSLSLSVIAADNQLTADEQQQGWKLLFDGKTMSKWRNFKRQNINSQWKVIEGAMTLTGKGGGDLLTRAQYQNFELSVDWKISEGGNSGIFILADETGKAIYSHAPEIQILDNERHSDKKRAHKPAEQWNTVRIKLLDNHLQVWQNGVSTTSIVIGSTTWQHLVDKSKYK